MEKIKLKRPIKTVKGDEEIKEVTIKDEKDMCAADFYDVKFSSDGTVALGDMKSAICNLCGLTEEQVASLHPKDYIGISGEVGKYIL